jgi:PadR family transcriptional regulator PadR
MAASSSLGEFEQIVLLAVLRLSEKACGASIRKEIAMCTDREPAPGALYTTLERLEEKAMLRSWLGEATPQQGGRAKRYFALTENGRSALQNAHRAYQRLLQGARPVWRDKRCPRLWDL